MGEKDKRKEDLEIETEVLGLNKNGLKKTTIVEYRKSQILRLCNCIVVAPVLVYTAVKYRKQLPTWLSLTLLASAGTLLFFEGRSFAVNFMQDGKLIRESIKNRKEAEKKLKDEIVTSTSASHKKRQAIVDVEFEELKNEETSNASGSTESVLEKEIVAEVNISIESDQNEIAEETNDQKESQAIMEATPVTESSITENINTAQPAVADVDSNTDVVIEEFKNEVTENILQSLEVSIPEKTTIQSNGIRTKVTADLTMDDDNNNDPDNNIISSENAIHSDERVFPAPLADDALKNTESTGELIEETEKNQEEKISEEEVVIYDDHAVEKEAPPTSAPENETTTTEQELIPVPPPSGNKGHNKLKFSHPIVNKKKKRGDKNKSHNNKQ